MTDPGRHDSPEQKPGYDSTDVNIRKILTVTLGSLFLLIAIVLVLSQYFTSYKEHRMYEAVLRPESAMLRALHAREDNILNSYAIVDKAAGQYRIPIQHAMELVAEEAYQAGKIDKIFRNYL